MTPWPALLLATLLSPVAGALLVSLAGSIRADRRAKWSRGVALAAASVSFLLSVAILVLQPSGTAEFARFDAGSLLYTEAGSIDVRLSIGLDGLSLLFVVMTTLLTLAALLGDPEPVRRRGGGYYSLVLWLEACLLGTFLARDVVLFYLFTESMMIPLFFLIGIWGKRERRAAALRFFAFGWSGGLLVLNGLLVMAMWHFSITGRMTTSMGELTALLNENPIPAGTQAVIFLVLLAGLAAKSAVFPLHGWLPATITEAPTGTGVILVGAALKVGGYGVVRFCQVMLPSAFEVCSPGLAWFCIAGMGIGAVAAVLQSDPRRILAYGCVSSVGFCMLGLVSTTPSGMQGGVLHLINSGLALGGLMLILGMLDQRSDSSWIGRAGTDRSQRRIFLFFVLILAAANAGMPGTAGFVGIRSILSSLPGPPTVVYIPVILGIGLGVCYSAKLAWRMIVRREGSDESSGDFQPGPSEPDHDQACPKSVTASQLSAVGLLSIVMVLVGVAPGFVLSRVCPTDINPPPHHRPSSANYYPQSTNHYPPITNGRPLILR